jgi:hypothetical protein
VLAALLALAVLCVSSSPPASAATPACQRALAARQVWIARYTGAVKRRDRAARQARTLSRKVKRSHGARRARYRRSLARARRSRAHQARLAAKDLVQINVRNGAVRRDCTTGVRPTR